MSIDFPADLIETIKCNSIEKQYKVICAVCHIGHSLQSGHYISLHFKDDSIIRCNDHIVTYENKDNAWDLLSSTSYLIALSLMQTKNT